MTASHEDYGIRAKELDAKLAHLEKAISPGPYFLGENFSIVDAFYAPLFRNFDVYEEAGENTFFLHRPRLETWRQILRARPSVQRAIPHSFNRTLKTYLIAQGGYLGERLKRLE